MSDLANEMEVIATSTTVVKEADFESKCKAVTLHCTEDVHVDFDKVANSGSFLLKKDLMINIPNCEFTRVTALASSTGGNLYIWARR